VEAMSSSRSMARKACPEVVAEGKPQVARKAAMEAPCDEQRLTHGVMVRQPAMAEGGHEKKVRFG